MHSAGTGAATNTVLLLVPHTVTHHPCTGLSGNMHSIPSCGKEINEQPYACLSTNLVIDVPTDAEQLPHVSDEDEPAGHPYCLFLQLGEPHCGTRSA
jgi:hypothetical protein